MALFGVSLGLLFSIAVEHDTLEGFTTAMNPEMELLVLLSQISFAGILG